MVVESFAIFIITICIIAIFARSGSPDYAVATLPVICVPFVHLAAYPLGRLILTSFPSIPQYLLFFIFDLTGLAIACFLIALFSTRIRSAKNKRMYIALLGVYCVVLTGIYVNDTVVRYLL